MNTKQEVLITYLKEMRSEINLRISNHNKLVAAKVVTCGALLGFLLAETIDPAVKTYGFLFVPLIAMLYDVMITKNIRCIHRIGFFIRDIIERNLLPQIMLWERHTGQKKVAGRNYDIGDVIFLSLFTFATVSFPIIYFFLKGKGIESIFFGIGLFLIQVPVMIIMCLGILEFREAVKIKKVKEEK